MEGEGQREALEQALRYLRNRVSLLVELPKASIDDPSLRRIGAQDGATPAARGRSENV